MVKRKSWLIISWAEWRILLEVHISFETCEGKFPNNYRPYTTWYKVKSHVEDACDTIVWLLTIKTHFPTQKLQLLRNWASIWERLTENVLATVLGETDLLVAAGLDLLDERLDSILYFQLLLRFSFDRSGIWHWWLKFGRLSILGRIAWVVLLCFHIFGISRCTLLPRIN